MRCLWITRQDPRSADSGELIYTRGLLQSLAAHDGIELTVLAHRGESGATGRDGGIDWQLPGPVPGKRILGAVSRLPGDADRLGNPKMRAALRHLLNDGPWDWIVIDQAACGWALDEIPAGSSARLAYVAHNHEATVRPQVAADHSNSFPMRLALHRDAAKYRRLENALAARADLITAITPRDEEAFHQDFPDKHIVVLPPGYDGPAPAGEPVPISQNTPRKVVLAGTFLWIAKRRNLEMFLEAAAEPFQTAGIEFLIVGKADPAFFERLASRHPWAFFRANVPTMEPYLRDARVGLIPEALGGGFKLKALDYIFRGLPLAAVESALSGLPLVPATDAISAPDPGRLAAEVAGRINNLGFLNLAARTALAKCRDAFHWADRGHLLHQAMSRQSPVTTDK